MAAQRCQVVRVSGCQGVTWPPANAHVGLTQHTRCEILETNPKRFHVVKNYHPKAPQLVCYQYPLELAL